MHDLSKVTQSEVVDNSGSQITPNQVTLDGSCTSTHITRVVNVVGCVRNKDVLYMKYACVLVIHFRMINSTLTDSRGSQPC